MQKCINLKNIGKYIAFLGLLTSPICGFKVYSMEEVNPKKQEIEYKNNNENFYICSILGSYLEEFFSKIINKANTSAKELMKDIANNELNEENIIEKLTIFARIQLVFSLYDARNVKTRLGSAIDNYEKINETYYKPIIWKICEV